MPIRFALEVAPPSTAAGVNAAAEHIRGELAKAGWRESTSHDVRARIEWSFFKSRWCALLRPQWWDGQESRGPVHCVDKTGFVELAAPSTASLLAEVATPMVQEIRASERERWVLRVRRPAQADQPVVLIGDADVSSHAQWVGDVALLSVAAGKKVVVKDGRCKREVQDGDNEVELQSLTARRRLVPEWKVDGRRVSEISIQPKTPFELHLALRDARAHENGGVLVPCAGNMNVTLAGSGLDSKETSRGDAGWRWDAQTTSERGTIIARVATVYSGEDGAIALSVQFHPPWWRTAWAGLVAGLAALGALVSAIALVASGVRKILGRRDANG